MDNTQLTLSPDPPLVADTMGIYTSDVRIVQDHFQAGLPCWFIRPAAGFNDQNILEVWQAELPFDLECEPHPYRHRVLAGGQAGTNKKFDVIHQYARNLMKYSDPFELGTTVNITPIAPPAVNTPQIVESSSSMGPTRTQQENIVRGQKGTRGNSHGRGVKESKAVYIFFINVDTD